MRRLIIHERRTKWDIKRYTWRIKSENGAGLTFNIYDGINTHQPGWGDYEPSRVEVCQIISYRLGGGAY
jgi:hypothetical protein